LVVWLILERRTILSQTHQQKKDPLCQALKRCAGIDVHLRFLVVCLSILEAGERRKEIRTFRNETADLLALRV
jgi:hypothetical protein